MKKNKITYHWEGDYLIPDLVLEEQPKVNYIDIFYFNMK